MRIKTSEASRLVLDYLVAKCHGFDGIDEDQWLLQNGIAVMPLSAYNPSTDPAQGAPILFRKRITIRHWHNEPFVTAYTPTPGSLWVHGKDPLEAGLRAWVHSELGEEIDVPDEVLICIT